MSIELILGGIGTFLGVANLVYWAWWSKRDKVEVVYPAVYAEFLPKGTRVDRPDEFKTFLNYAELSIEVSCELVLTRGEKKLEVKEVEVILDKKTYKSLKKYFQLPFRNRLTLYHVSAYGEKSIPQPIVLEPKITVQFKRALPFNCTDEFEKEYKKMEDGSYPDFIQSLLDELETKYQICWTRYDDKRLCWRFPQKWWQNLGKKLWG
ncbi:hypothetical protein ES703_90356 [subsurface metagenome]